MKVKKFDCIEMMDRVWIWGLAFIYTKGVKFAVGFLLWTGKRLGVRELFCHLLLLPHAEGLISISAPRARATYLSVGKDTRSWSPTA